MPPGSLSDAPRLIVLAATIALAATPAALPEEPAPEPGDSPSVASSGAADPVTDAIELATKLRKAQRYEQAIAALERVRTPEVGAASLHEIDFVMGQVHFSRGQAIIESRFEGNDGDASVREAIRIFERMLRDFPKGERVGGAAYLIGSSHLVLDELEKARSAYYRAYKDYPDSKLRPGSLLRVGVCESGLDRADAAVKTFRSVLREFPENTGIAKKARKYILEHQLVGRAAPPIAANEWLHGLVGSDGLRTFDGQVVVLVFFATWCSHCSHNMPRLQALVDHWSNEGVVFLGVANPDDPMNTEPVDAYVQKNGIDFLDVALDRTFGSWRSYRVTGLPAVAIIDRRGVVRWRGNLSFLPVPMLGKLQRE